LNDGQVLAQRLFVTSTMLPPPSNAISAPLALTTEVPLAKRSGPFESVSRAPLTSCTRSPVTRSRLPPPTRTSAPPPTVSVALSSFTTGPTLVSFTRWMRSIASNPVVSVLLLLRLSSGAVAASSAVSTVIALWAETVAPEAWMRAPFVFTG